MADIVWRRAVIAGIVAMTCLLRPGGCAAQQAATVAAAQSPQTQQPSQRTGSVSGSVMDADGDALAGADVQLSPAANHALLHANTDGSGEFRVSPVPAGGFTLTVSAPGLAPVTVRSVAVAGEEVALAPIALRTVTASISVNAMSPHEAAEIQVKQEETQRVFGVIPNFGVTYDWHAPPLDTRQKFELATRAVIDPVTFGVSAVQAGVEQATGTYDFGSGPAGYFKRFGAATADVAIGSELGGAVLPTIFRQDPRYFWKGTGTVRSRVLYAVSQVFVCRSDHGTRELNYSNIIGNFGAGAISNLYYPAANRNGVGLTFANGAIGLGSGAVGNLVEEFLIKKLTPRSRKIPATAP